MTKKKQTPPLMLSPAVCGFPSPGDLAQGVFTGDLRVEASQELLPCGKTLAIAVAGDLFDQWSKRYRGMNLKSC